ncbi:MAG: pyruvate phosphate dikinase PEP/pyruvate-binding protein [Leptolyngbya sp. SIO4C5]|nr:pyruvate phosphate dikinase PEP/pyruvate-binding protein [Leptolyngbya sp. SIO4C5]
MTLTQVLGALLIFVLCPLLGGLPLTGWITRLLSGKRLSQVGTGNIGVSAAFYHGGRVAGILSVCAEAFKGIAAVLLARYYFPTDSTWEVVALIALVLGRYWIGKGAGTTNVVWGIWVHDWITAALTFLISGIGFTILRERRQGRLLVLIVLPIITALRHGDEGSLVLAMVCLSGLIAWIYQKLPDDLELPSEAGRIESQSMFRFFQGDRALLSLDQPLQAEKVGSKAATLAQLRRWGYPVPLGYVLPAGDDPAPLIEISQPSPEQPVIVRSSAVGEDTEAASAAGQYVSIANVKSRAALTAAIARCFASYNSNSAQQYRRDRRLPEGQMSVLVQTQVQGLFSGVAFSRDPIARHGDAVIIEALPGGAEQVVSGQVTPQSYQVMVQPEDIPSFERTEPSETWQLPAALTLQVEGSGTVPPALLQRVAFLARHLEERYYGIPQDIEWSYDGEQIWLLQSRPITTLLPIWTRKIAAEVIPGYIRPLTWSINRPLTCGVWGQIFTLVLGDRANDLDFEQTATLHYSQAYFNASLLGNIFRRMGLPPESLEFLTRGAKFSKPPLASTLRNLPGLLRLASRELRLRRDFQKDNCRRFQPALTQLAEQPASQNSPAEILERIERLLALLQTATYYSILAPLSLAIRQAVLQVDDTDLNSAASPEVESMRSLRAIAQDSRSVLSSLSTRPDNSASLFAALAETADAHPVLERIDRFLHQYGYLSEVGTDIAVPTWRENPHPVRELFAQFLLNPPPPAAAAEKSAATGWKTHQVQRRLDLKGQVTEVYSRLLAELRWSFVALEQQWIQSRQLEAAGDIFFLQLAEIRAVIRPSGQSLPVSLAEIVTARRSRFEQDQTLKPTPYVIYGHQPPAQLILHSPVSSVQTLKGIGASPGQAVGQIRILESLQSLPDISTDTILVVPYTDSGWAPLLSRSGGLIAEVGGRLSHGAIVAREYGIPAVMDVTHALQRLHDGQRVRIDGQAGTVEVLS